MPSSGSSNSDELHAVAHNEAISTMATSVEPLPALIIDEAWWEWDSGRNKVLM